MTFNGINNYSRTLIYPAQFIPLIVFLVDIKILEAGIRTPTLSIVKSK